MAREVSGLRDGGAADGESFNQLFERLYQPVVWYDRKRGFAAVEAQDLAQDSFVKVSLSASPEDERDLPVADRLADELDDRATAEELWQVADLSTVAFMDRFYDHLMAGSGRAEALRAAQQDLLDAPVELTRADGRRLPFDASHPRYWAGFQLIGAGR